MAFWAGVSLDKSIGTRAAGVATVKATGVWDGRRVMGGVRVLNAGSGVDAIGRALGRWALGKALDGAIEAAWGGWSRSRVRAIAGKMPSSGRNSQGRIPTKVLTWVLIGGFGVGGGEGAVSSPKAWVMASLVG